MVFRAFLSAVQIWPERQCNERASYHPCAGSVAGIPATGLTLQLWKLTDGMSKLLYEEVTNSDGRLDAPLLEGNEMEAGCYELLFMVGDYYRRADAKASAAGIGVTESSADTQREMSFS